MITREPIKIREATQAERPLVAEITKSAYAQYGPLSNPKFWSQYEVNTEKTLLEREDVVRIVALCGEEIAAAVLYCPPYELEMGGKMVKNPFPEMRLLGVLPQFRDRGIGALLIDHCEQRAAGEGFDEITLHTTELMQTAKAMYERRGYTRYKHIDFEPVPGFIVVGYKKRVQEKVSAH